MASTKDLKQFRIRNYLAKDFDALRAQLVQYARLYYPDKIQDFSEASMGGMLLDLAAYTGDVMSFYLDHQYNELDPDTAIELDNIEKLIRRAGVPITGASPAVVSVTVTIEVPAVLDTFANVYLPSASAIPIIRANSVFTSLGGVDFQLLSDIDFQRKNSGGDYLAEIRVGRLNLSGDPLTFIMSLSGTCVSGKQTSETFMLQGFEPFKRLTLAQSNVTDILSVIDNKGNNYYRVNFLTDDVVYRNVANLARDSEEISESLKVVPAPYRFVVDVDLASRKSTLVLGGGEDTSIENDAVPDPSDFAISFPYSKTFTRTSINPLQLLQTRTVGVYSPDSVLTVIYRYGGGLSHNAPPGTITNISSLLIDFPMNPSLDVISLVRNSIRCTNKMIATGGEDAPSVNLLKALIPSIKNSQERIVTKEDLLARVYTLPSNFGRVFRAAVRSNPNNPLTSQLFVISRSSNSKLVYSSDTLKENLKKYLNQYRLVTDAIDILDSPIVNLTMAFDVLVDPSLNKQIVLQNILSTLFSQLQVVNFSIDQPIVISDIQNTIYAAQGVVSVIKMEFFNASGTYNNRVYSDFSFDVKENTRKGMIYPPPGGMFEFKFPDLDIVGRAV
jgi:hypothetical protein